MSRSSSSVVREIKNRISILDVVRRYVELKHAGNRWVAPCPFHQETKPSFSVNEEEGFFYCFGCQAAGDLFDFYGRINGLDFKDSLEQLAEEAGISLQGSYKPNPRAAQERNIKKTALQMYGAAGDFFKNTLKTPAAETCRSYLKGRALSPEILEKFQLGWSLPEWQGLADFLRRSGFNLNLAADIGLVVANDRGGFYDRFRGRLMFPIANMSGQIIAFGGRIIGDEDAAKYINSSDSILYKKGDNLYGLYEARRAIAVHKSVFLTEGYMDVLTLHQFGYENSCGVLGTALTDEQVRRLAGFCSTFELIFDGDAPGRKAAFRAAEMVLCKGLRCNVVLLPEKVDIDELLHNQGKEAFDELRRFAPDGLDFCIRMLSSQFAPKEILEWIRGFIEKIEYPELLTQYVSRLSQALDLDESEIRQTARKAQAEAGKTTQKDSSLNTKALGKGAFDRAILKFVVRYPRHLPTLQEAGAFLLLSERWAHGLWEKIAASRPHFDSNDILRSLTDSEKEFWGQYRVMDNLPRDTEQQELKDICDTVARLCLEKQNSACIQAMRQSAAMGSEDSDIELLRAVNETLVQRRSLRENK